MFDEYYTQLKQNALTAEASPGDIENMTREEIASMLNVNIDDPSFTGGNAGLLENLKRNLVNELTKQQQEADRDFIINELTTGGRVAFAKRFPNYEIELGRELERAVIKIYPEGKPEVANEQQLDA